MKYLYITVFINFHSFRRSKVKCWRGKQISMEYIVQLTSRAKYSHRVVGQRTLGRCISANFRAYFLTATKAMARTIKIFNFTSLLYFPVPFAMLHSHPAENVFHLNISLLNFSMSLRTLFLDVHTFATANLCREELLFYSLFLL